LGYGYLTDASGNHIKIYDTFSPDGQNPGSMLWGGTYQYGNSLLQHYGVTAMTLATVPVPGAILLCAIGSGFVGWLRRRRLL
jgi:hypothetical protein